MRRGRWRFGHLYCRPNPRICMQEGLPTFSVLLISSVGPDLGQCAAISASILVEDENEDARAHLLDGVSEDIGPPLSGGGEVVLALWSGVLSAYGKGAEGVCDCVSGVLGSLPLVSAAGLGDWASGQLMELLNAAGLEPANTAAAKSVTSNTLPVAERGTGPVAEAICALKGGGS